ncbi:MAG: hypothetical protein JO029_02240 [Candidatus Eremiobacteraeota bacterium]|nr:hypothetical protein [Candidatus Eremiobacteraeota bacterium]MBV8283938.1 hypothetical protein [Candidatus Eremiobacteraeota bacterium]MBV8332998.1 hypothetical protein [Candidatus Eremiobacteraeota bacterium]MBV8433081.1 hypothetical protein [Candidatus Eremiobacteraeota bacterium]MBV8582526.1 hypothetical protein [Candidatus Eremiobacteraeota bacterium]
MFRDPFRTTPLVADISDVNLRLRVQRADSALFSNSEYRLPNLQIR